MSFMQQFPSILFDDGQDLDDVDISVEDIRLPSVQNAIQASIDESFEKWDKLNPISAVEMLVIQEQKKLTQEYARVALKDENDGSLTLQEHNIKEIFSNLLTEKECLERRQPCPRIQEFIEKHPPTRKVPIENPPTPSWMFAKRSHSVSFDEMQTPLDETIYLVEIMHPSQNIKKSQLMLVLGSQPLTTLADAIYCRTHQYLKEYGLHSKMIYIGGKVFIDKRDPKNVDYSWEVRTWLQKNPSLVSVYPGFDRLAGKMEDITLNDLSLTLNASYLFLHLGNCEHILHIHNIRLMHDEDEQNMNEYPIRLTKNLHHQKCLICTIRGAKYVTFGDLMAIDDPMYYCDCCYYTAHYDKDGKLIDSNFKVFPFYPDD